MKGFPSYEEIKQKTETLDNLHIITSENIFCRLFGIDVIIPAGLPSDGASLPWYVEIFIDKFDNKILFAAIIHDYVYITQFMPRIMADIIFREVLKETAGTYIAYMFYYGVRIGGWIGWRRNQINGLHKFPKAKHDLKKYICKQT